MRKLGVWLLIVGGIISAFAIFVFDPSIASGDGSRRVNNFGLMQDRQNYLILGCALAIVGAILTALSGRPDIAEIVPTSKRDGAEIESDLLSAIKWENLARIRQLLDAGEVKADGESRAGRSWLVSAIARGKVAAVALLLERGAKADQPDSQKSFPLAIAKQGGQAEIIALVQSYAEPSSGKARIAASVKPLALPEQLERLVVLREKGMLSPDEFDKAKARILGA